MINFDELFHKVIELDYAQLDFKLIKIENVYFGKSKEGNIVFCKDVDNENICHMEQSTKFLSLKINISCKVEANGELKPAKLSIISLKSDDYKLIETFLRLAISISSDISDEKFNSYFNCLKLLFSNENKKSLIELQGFYGELYVIKYMYEQLHLDLSEFYQKEDKMKFDFSLTPCKKLEVKSTLSSDRKHHFKQEQLNTNLYDIVVASILLRKDDQGYSLYELVDYCKVKFANNFNFLLHIEKFIRNIEEEVLQGLCFNEEFTNQNLKLISAEDIPKLPLCKVENISNIEFDSNLSCCHEIGIENFEKWLKIEDKINV